MSRHAILYDVARWQANRTLLVGTALLLFGSGVTLPLLRPGLDPFPYEAFGSVLGALSVHLWSRQRFTWMSVDGGALRIRAGFVDHRIPVERLGNVRVGTLGSLASGPQRRLRVLRRRPRFTGARTNWESEPALLIRLPGEDDARRVRRMVGRRCVLDRDLLVPLADASALRDAIEGARPRTQRPARRKRSR